MNLNKEQEDAIKSENEAILVLAGAGTGKTRVIIKKIEEIVKNGMDAEKIVATTFTNKAAKEMKERLVKGIGEKGNKIICGTFHRISAQILREHGKLIGVEENFQILNEDDQNKLIKRIAKEENIEIKSPRKAAEEIATYKESSGKKKIDSGTRRLIEIYEDELRSQKFLDYSDLIQLTIRLFTSYPEVAKSIAEYILVDEYQDVNEAQYKWIRQISEGKKIFCVGDEDQSIYAFRGADIKYIRKFEEDYPKAEIIKLEANYRSTKEILKGATNVIQKNPRKFEKKLIAANEEEKGIIKITKTYNEFEEAIQIGKIVAHWKEKDKDCKIGILVRTNAQVPYIEQGLIQAKIPYQISGGRKFYMKSEIQTLIAYLRVILFPHDYLAFSRILNSPKRGIGETRLETLLKAMKSLNCNPEEALASLLPQLPQISGEKCKLLLLQLHEWRTLKGKIKLDALLKKIIDDTEFRKQEDFKETQKASVENLLTQIAKVESLEEFIENLQFSSEEESRDIEIMTMHAAKGLEFDIVITPGWEENVFPSPLSKTKEELEEERRLAYVTITRAKKALEITHATTRRINGRYQMQMPSRFIFDL